MLSRKLHLDPFHLQTSLQLFLLCHQMKTHEKILGLFNLSPALGVKCVNENVNLVIQHPSLGSITERPTDTSEILKPMHKPGQEPSIYICLSSVKTADLSTQNEKDVSS